MKSGDRWRSMLHAAAIALLLTTLVANAFLLFVGVASGGHVIVLGVGYLIAATGLTASASALFWGPWRRPAPRPAPLWLHGAVLFMFLATALVSVVGSIFGFFVHWGVSAYFAGNLSSILLAFRWWRWDREGPQDVPGPSPMRAGLRGEDA